MESVLTSPAILPANPSGSRARLWTSRVLFALVMLFMTFDTAVKLLELVPADQATGNLGWAPTALFGIGVVELVCIAAYAIPRTSILGALLLTGYLGGAVATHARIGNPLFTHTLFPIYIAVLAWGALYLRDARLRALLPFRTQRED